MKNLNNIMILNRHYVLLLLMAILMIPSQDVSAKKKKQVKEPTDRELDVYKRQGIYAFFPADIMKLPLFSRKTERTG